MSASGASEGTLYNRLGGYDAIAGMVDDLLGRLGADPQLTVYFKGMNTARKTRARQLIVEYLCNATGGPVFYTGGDMKREHEGLGITSGEWAAFMRYSQAMLDHRQVPAREQREVLDFLSGLEGDVVEGSESTAGGV